jgi:uncharacterized membrane protein YgcG
MTEKRAIAVKCTVRQLSILNILLFVEILFFLGLPSFAYPFNVPNLRGYVNDYADMITPSVKGELENKLSAFEQTDSTQIVILTIPSLDGETIEEFSLKVANKWKLGQSGKDNGVLFVVSKQDRKMRIEVGPGLEGRLPSPAIRKLIDQIIKPKFSGGDFDGGFIAGVSALVDATKGAYTAEHPAMVQQAPLKASERGIKDKEAFGACGTLCGSFIFIIIAIFVLNIAILVWVAKDAKNRGMGSSVGWIFLILFTGVIGLIIYLFSRPKGELIICDVCKNKKFKVQRICPHCGNSATSPTVAVDVEDQQQFCKRCGAKIAAGASFCQKCGDKIDNI